MRKQLLLVLFGCLYLTVVPQASAHATTYSSHYGVVDRWLGDNGNGVNDIKMQNLGAKWIRCAFDWDEIEIQDDVYDWYLQDSMIDAMDAIGVNCYIGIGYTPSWARSGGTRATPPTDPTKYTDFITVQVNRYKDRVKYWGLWNEPNLTHFYSGTFTSYINNLLIPGIDAIKAADPTAKTVIGELSTSGDDVGKLRQMLQAITAAGKKDLVDVICHHSYDGKDTYTGRMADMDILRAMIVAEGYGDKDFWITETSWDSGGTNGETNQANQLIGMMEGMNARPWIKKIFWYTLGEGASGGPGLTRPDHSLKPSYIQYQQYIADHADDSEMVSDTIPATMVAGRQYYVSVTVKNTGTITWDDHDVWKLGAVGDTDPFAGGRQYLNPGEAIAPDETKTFWFSMTAPTATGTYTTDWRMVREYVRWFGHPLVKQVVVNNGPDTTPPGPVTNFTAAPGDYKVTLSWQNPTDADFAATMIRFSTTNFPANASDGTLVIDRINYPGTSESYVHTGRTNGVTYYYSAFTRDEVMNIGSKADASATATDNEPPDPVTAFAAEPGINQSLLSWTNPLTSDYEGTLIRFRTDTYPAGPTDGILLCDRSAAPDSSDSYLHSGIDNGTTYYYAAFAYDEVPNYASAATAAGRPVGPRINFSTSPFTSGADGWTLSLWKADPSAVDAQIAWNAAAGRTGGGIRCNGGGITDDTFRCLREGGELRKIISTAGYESIRVSYDLRVNSLGANHTGSGTGGCAVDHNLIDEQLSVFYSTDGGLNWIEAEYITRSALLSHLSYGTRQIDLSGIGACDNNASFALRFRWQFNTTSDTGDLDNIVVSGTALGGPDLTPPAAVTAFSANRGDKLVNLTWTNPSSPDFAGTLIRFKTTGYPSSPTDGSLVCNKTNIPGSNDSFIHTSLTNGVTYYYSAFAYDAIPNYSAKSDASATPADTTPPANVSGFTAIRGNTRNTLTWNNPSTSDFTGTMVRFKTTGYPTGPNDGILVVDKANSPSTSDSYVHEGLTNGVIHYYRAYAHDAVPNYAPGASVAVNPVYFTPLNAKLLSNHVTALITESIVSASFNNMFYVQAPDRLIGIRVDQPGHTLQVGQSVGVRGTLLTDVVTDERYILADWSAVHGSGAVSPVAMNAASLGGIDWSYNSGNGAGQKGIASAIGPNNIGLLVRTWGKVTQRQTSEPKYFYIDDGSGLRDGTKTGAIDNIGIRIVTDPAAYTDGDYLVITGISSCLKVGSEIVPKILPASIEVVEP